MKSPKPKGLRRTEPDGLKYLESWAKTNPAFRFNIDYRGVEVGDDEPLYIVSVRSVHTPKIVWCERGYNLYHTSRRVIVRSGLSAKGNVV
jgi:hypothetical protein